MATTIQIKRSQTGTSAPTLAYGELSYSFEDATRKLWIGDNAASTVEVVGGRYYTDLFKTTITDGKSEVGKLLMTDSTSGHLLMESKNITGINDLASATATIGDGTKDVVISTSSSTSQIHGKAGTN